MNKLYVRDDVTEKDSDWISGAALIVVLLIGALGMLFLTFSAVAQTITAPTRVSDADWSCLDASGAALSNHQRFDTAFVACYNNAQGVEIVGGRYRINRSTAPPVEPPVEPPPPPTPGAPANLAATFAPHATNPANSNVTLTWGAVAGAAEYEVWRCVGPTCTDFKFLADEPSTTYTAFDQPPNSTQKYRVRAWKPTTGPYSAVLTVTTPNTPTLGSATVTWQHDAPTTLAGYRIVYGATANALVSTVQVPNPALTAYVIDALPAGTWFFAVRAYNAAGAESVNSNVASKVLP